MARLPYPNFRSQNTSPKHHIRNILKLLSYSSATVEHWANVDNAQFKSLALSKRGRELVILLSTTKFKPSYERTHHIPISRKAGVADPQRSEIEEVMKQEDYFQDGKFNADADFSDKDKVLLSFVEATIEQPEVSDELWADVRNILSDREIVEIISLKGFYYTPSRLTTVLNVEVDDFARSNI